MKKPKIIHILANGKKVNSIEGHIIPTDNPVYEMVLGARKGMGKGHQCKKQIV